jgi:hypothetical protein
MLPFRPTLPRQRLQYNVSAASSTTYKNKSRQEKKRGQRGQELGRKRKAGNGRQERVTGKSVKEGGGEGREKRKERMGRAERAGKVAEFTIQQRM